MKRGSALFHGGVRGLYPGGLLLPPSRSRAHTTADYGAEGACRRDRVYLITEEDQAHLFALMAPPKGRGWVYEIEALGELEVDSDYSGPGGSFCVPEARVVRVVARNVETFQGLTAKQAARVLLTPDGDRYACGERLLRTGRRS